MMRWLCTLLGAYLLSTLLVGCVDVLSKPEGVSWLLILLFGIPIWLVAEMATHLIAEILLPAAFREKAGPALSIALLVLLFSVILFASWLTIQQFKS